MSSAAAWKCSTCTSGWKTPDVSTFPGVRYGDDRDGHLPHGEHRQGFCSYAEHAESIAAVKRLLDDVMRALRRDMSCARCFVRIPRLMARKVVERTGKAGEHLHRRLAQ